MPESPGALSLPTLLIVLGPPASGKTTLAPYLSRELALPLMTKDMIKELLFDTLGCDDLEQSRRLGYASIMLLLQYAESHVAARCSCLIECNYRAAWHTPHFAELQRRHPFHPVQVLCRADPAVLLERYRQRAESGERHPGHLDGARLPNLDAASLAEQCQPLALGGPVVEVDTTDFSTVDYPAVLAQIKAACRRR